MFTFKFFSTCTIPHNNVYASTLTFPRVCT